MSAHSAIGWTNATWNPVTGCSRVSPGCEHCYAESLSLRMGWSKKPWTNQNAAENVKLHPERLDAPLRWRAPRMVFVNSMSDLFHERVPSEFIARVFGAMETANWHTYQVLTKRADRMRDFVKWRQRFVDGMGGDYLQRHAHIWLGVSVEDERRAAERLPLLLETPAAVRFISAEPLLGRIQLDGITPRLLHWVILGGESGPNYRPMDLDWAEEIAARCTEAGVALFVKQDSGPRPGKQGRLSDALWARKEYPVGAQSGEAAP